MIRAALALVLVINLCGCATTKATSNVSSKHTLDERQAGPYHMGDPNDDNPTFWDKFVYVSEILLLLAAGIYLATEDSPMQGNSATPHH